MATAPRPNSPGARAATDGIQQAISAHLRAQHLPPTQTWLAGFPSTVRPQTPLAAQQKTALFRLLAADLTTAVEPAGRPSSVFPADIVEPTIRERTLPGPIPAQVLDVEDIGRSRWSQVEALEAALRGETTKGREVIRVVPDEQAGGGAVPDVAGRPAASSGGPHKLLLQDARGTKVFAVELESVRGVGVQMGIGAKVVLRDVVVARGAVMLRPASVEVLGGRVEVWDKKWRGERLQVLKRMAGVESTEGD